MKIEMKFCFENGVAVGRLIFDAKEVATIHVDQNPEALRHIKYMAKCMSLTDGDLK